VFWPWAWWNRFHVLFFRTLAKVGQFFLTCAAVPQIFFIALILLCKIQSRGNPSGLPVGAKCLPLRQLTPLPPPHMVRANSTRAFPRAAKV
jgi:hypothetical protein